MLTYEYTYSLSRALVCMRKQPSQLKLLSYNYIKQKNNKQTNTHSRDRAHHSRSSTPIVGHRAARPNTRDSPLWVAPQSARYNNNRAAAAFVDTTC